MKWIETKRLLLRRFSHSDLSDFGMYASDAELRRQFGWRKEADREYITKLFGTLLERDGVYAVICKENEKMIGHISVVIPAELSLKVDDALYGKKGATLAFAVAPEHQRKGYMTEALTAVIEYLFSAVRLDFIHCGYFGFNKASRQLQAGLGFICYGSHNVVRYGEKIEIIDNLLMNKDKVNEKQGVEYQFTMESG